MTQDPRPIAERDIATIFLRWSLMRAVFHRGWWLVTSIYLVEVAGLSAPQLLIYGAVLALTTVIAEVPTGVVADAISRKWSLVIAHLVMGTGMATMGFVTAFPLILVTQVLWALGWTFSSGADVAWVTDELDRPDRIARVLIARGRWEQLGGIVGIVGFGALAWAAGLGVSIAVAGSGMVLLGLFVVLRFTEHHFTPVRRDRWRESASIFRRGLALARGDRQILVILAATLLVNAGGEAFDFLSRKQLLDLGFPDEPDPVVWFTVLGIAALAFGALVLRIIEARIDGAGAAPRFYVAASFAGALGLFVLAQAPNAAVGMAGALLVEGMAWPATRSVGVIWVNRRVTSDVRATVHSFLSQAESVGESLGGICFGVFALTVSISAVLTWSGAVIAMAGVLIIWSRVGRGTGVEAVDR